MKYILVLLCFLLFTSLEGAPKQLDFIIYDPVGESGKQQIIIDGSKVTSSLYQTWNNRVVDYKESMQLNEMGFPESFQVTGTSAFGAEIEEMFSCRSGSAEWQSTAESGSAASKCDAYYYPLDSAGGLTSLLYKISSDKGTLDLLPSGKLQATAIAEQVLEEGDKKITTRLFAFAGLGFSPDFLWLDEEGYLFAIYSSGGGSLRKGWDRKHLETLGAVEELAEQSYYEQLTKDVAIPLIQDLMLKNVGIVDVKAGVRNANQDILISQGKITQIGTNLKASSSTIVIDAEDKTLIPGLWDMHGHLSIGQGVMNMAAGVTSVRDIGNEHDNIMRVESLFESKKVIGPTVYRSGFIDKLSPYAAKSSKTAETLEQALDYVDWFAERGYGQIKLYSSIEPDWVKPLADRAHAKGMRISGHIPAFMTAEEAVQSGFDEIQHMNMLFLNFLGKDIDTRKKLRFTIPGNKGGQLDLSSKPVQDFIQLLKDKGTVVDPTISIIMYAFNAEAGVSNVTMQDIAANLPPTVQRSIRQGMLKIDEAEREAYRKSADNMLAMVKVLHDAGVQVVPGTDFYVGVGLHTELKHYVTAGLSEASVLRLATIDSAKIVGADKMTGSIEVGKAADLVLIDGNPLQDMADIRNTALVIQGSNMYKPDALWQASGITPFVESIKLD